MAVSKRLRHEIMRRDNHTCRYCGQSAPGVALTIDHVTPVTLGGSDGPDNLVTACVDCNAGKSSVPASAPLVEDVAQDAFRWSRAMELAARADDQKIREAFVRDETFLGHWEQWTLGDGSFVPLPNDWRSSLRSFERAGVSMLQVGDAVRKAMESQASTSSKWRYFCGVCWKMAAQNVERALAILASEDL